MAVVSRLAALLDGETEIINAYKCKASPCIDCRYCWTNDWCVIKDEMQGIYRAIDEADNIIVASPIYFHEVTGPVLSLLSRLQSLWAARHFRHKELLKNKVRYGAVILVDGGEGKKDRALSTSKILLNVMNADFKGLIYFSGTDISGSSAPVPGIQVQAEIERMAKVLNSSDRLQR